VSIATIGAILLCGDCRLVSGADEGNEKIFDGFEELHKKKKKQIVSCSRYDQDIAPGL